MKLTKIAAVVALAAAGSAHAWVNTALNSSEIYLAAYDTADTHSFLYDTGLNVSSLIGGTINANINISADANWSNFVSTVGGLANVNWSVEAIQFQNGKNTKFIYSTLGAGASVGTAGTNVAFNGPLTSMNNALSASSATTGTSEIAAAGTASYFGHAYDNWNVDGVAQLSNAYGVSGVSFFGAANSDTTKGTLKNTIFATPTPVASFSTVSGNSVLTIATPAVPEPTTGALTLAALAGIGFVARRRAK